MAYASLFESSLDATTAISFKSSEDTSRTEKRNQKKYDKKKGKKKLKHAAKIFNQDEDEPEEADSYIFQASDEVLPDALYEVQISHISGLGLYAVRDIPRGVLILSELAMIHHKGSDSSRTEVIRLFESLSNKTKAAYLCLPGPKYGNQRTGTSSASTAFTKEILEIYNNNSHLIAHTSSLCLCPPDQDTAIRAPAYSRAIFRTLSLVNHSCIPNTTLSLLKPSSSTTPTASLRANRLITAGEELTITYDLPKPLPFACRCPLCNPSISHFRPGPSLPVQKRIPTAPNPSIYARTPHTTNPPQRTQPTLPAAIARAKDSLKRREYLIALLAYAEDETRGPSQRVKWAEDALAVMGEEAIGGVDVGRAYGVLAECNAAIGRRERAGQARRLQVSVFEDVLGGNHPVAFRARALLGKIF